jgi:diadenosine tetraphosphate (Ap4A) HIT family hydrolase
MAFKLHPQLDADSIAVGDLPLCRVLLMNDSRFRWLILVPRRDDMQEIYQLSMTDQQLFWQESALVAEKLMQLTQADKMNIAALGNKVPQLHVHHIARFKTDAAWPNPVWGHGESAPYTEKQQQDMLGEVQNMLSGFFVNGQRANV